VTNPSAGLPALLERLGQHKMSGWCLHFKKLSDVDPAVLTKLVAAGTGTIHP
jgi:hypothetical protein